jgi:hypothetical protein
MEADKDGDGKISFEEFTHMVESTDITMSMTLGKSRSCFPHFVANIAASRSILSDFFLRWVRRILHYDFHMTTFGGSKKSTGFQIIDQYLTNDFTSFISLLPTSAVPLKGFIVLLDKTKIRASYF